MATPDPSANVFAIDGGAISNTSDLSGLSSIPFLANQSRTAQEHDSKFLMLSASEPGFDCSVQLSVIGILMILHAV